MGETAIVVAKKRRSLQPLAIVAREQETITVLSHQYIQEAIKGMRSKDEYRSLKMSELVTTPTAQYTNSFGKDGKIIVQIRLDQGETFDNLKAAIMGLDDNIVDTWLALLAIGLEQNGYDPKTIRVPFMVNPDDILAICGKDKTHRSYTVFQRAEVIRNIKVLSQCIVTASHSIPPSLTGKKSKKEPAVMRASGPLLDLHKFTIGAYTTIMGDEMWERKEICLGAFIKDIVEVSPQTAIMLRKVLAYSGKNERYQKRIGQYLSMMFRVNARHGLTDNVGIFPNDISMQALLDGAHVEFPRERGQFRDAIVNALQRLKADGVIGNYWKVVESVTPENAEKIEQHARGWFDLWLQTKWNFTAPPMAQEQYAEIVLKAQKANAKRQRDRVFVTKDEAL